MLKTVDEFVRMREITRSVKVALKCIIAAVLVDVDLPHRTSKVEHLVAFTAIFSNICTAHAQKRLFMNFWCKVLAGVASTGTVGALRLHHPPLAPQKSRNNGGL